MRGSARSGGVWGTERGVRSPAIRDPGAWTRRLGGLPSCAGAGEYRSNGRLGKRRRHGPGQCESALPESAPPGGAHRSRNRTWRAAPGPSGRDERRLRRS